MCVLLKLICDMSCVYCCASILSIHKKLFFSLVVRFVVKSKLMMKNFVGNSGMKKKVGKISYFFTKREIFNSDEGTSFLNIRQRFELATFRIFFIKSISNCMLRLLN